ncbi:CAP domain-containing protein [Bizionia paragorgiae]|jgi:uncharacterized protein YkwD|uniref:CAP domain-containing protein n=1 Tax=Bizionia paragorgiae TaxID=283786 RepID=UPI00299EE7A1|nr:CAP domain-containing protein [Bizionia paragorgiae]MDX1272030.1 CAP domain-containing protein [Bizionia paragorgiae]
MNRLINLLCLVLLLSFSTACSSDSDEDFDVPVAATIPTSKTIEIEILELINAHRINLGLNTLSDNPLVKGQAYSHTEYMIQDNEISHDYFYSRENYLVQHAGAVRVGENVAYGYTNAEAVVNAWIASEGHRENIEGDFTNFEISAEQNSLGQWFYTNIFIKK